MTATLTDRKSEVLKYTQSLCETLEIDFRLYNTKQHRLSAEKEMNADYHNQCLQQIADGTYDFGYKYEIEEGKKYLKVIMIAHGSKSVHCFVDKNTGEVYKSATWKSPAKGVRFNLLDDTSREECYRLANWAGSHLYAR
jgi:hypothetical protein